MIDFDKMETEGIALQPVEQLNNAKETSLTVNSVTENEKRPNRSRKRSTSHSPRENRSPNRSNNEVRESLRQSSVLTWFVRDVHIS